jgi:hypothetical protein
VARSIAGRCDDWPEPGEKKWIDKKQFRNVKKCAQPWPILLLPTKM